MDFSEYIHRQREWSLVTFGNGARTDGISKHIRHELEEIANANNDVERLEECIDVIILAMDMAWRLGFQPNTIEQMLHWKQEKNFARKWPAREVSEANQSEPTFHIKENDNG